MKRSRRFWLIKAATAVLAGAAAGIAAAVICTWLSHGSELLHFSINIMALFIFITTGLWYMTAVLYKCDRQDLAKFRELDEKHKQESQLRGGYTAGLYDLSDDEQNKVFYNLRGERVKPGDAAGPMVTAFRMAAIISMMFSITIFVSVICAVLGMR